MTPDRIASIHWREIVRPLRVFFATSLGGKDTMRSLLVRVTLEDGSSGIGECPTSAAFPHETVPVMKTLLAQWARELKGTPMGEWEDRARSLRRRHFAFPMAVSGMEAALFRAFLSNRGMEERVWWGGELKKIETDITIPFIPGHPSLAPWVDYGIRRGFRVFKIKVSGRVEEDRKFLSALLDHIGRKVPGFTVRLDGNQGYDARSFLRMTDYLEKSGQKIELFEQPLPRDDYRGLKEITRRSPVPVILDETVVTCDDLTHAIDEGMGTGVNIKTAKSGILESRDILALARKAGFRLMIGCMTETWTGLSTGVCLAAGSGAFDYIDLDGIYFLHHRNIHGVIEARSPRFFFRDQRPL